MGYHPTVESNEVESFVYRDYTEYMCLCIPESAGLTSAPSQFGPRADYLFIQQFVALFAWSVDRHFSEPLPLHSRPFRFTPLHFTSPLHQRVYGRES